MGTCQIEWKKSALRELKRLDRQAVPRIIAAVDSLATHPLPDGVRKLQGSQHTYRLRVGTYRVIYELYESRLLIEIVRVRHRKDAYRA
ncbi:MAG: type II toxin-antitoxin system RelE/ParE family toxin [Planctomycetota bacterium]|nr:type II toxin-antitoxin system RelE/ParE family toxin [Planctomycetota bacterium]